MALNCWWATREIKASAARVIRVTFDHERRTATRLSPESKRDPHAAGEARTHGCGCADEVRHSVCPHFVLVQHCALLASGWGLASTLFSATCRCSRPTTVIRCSSIRSSRQTVRLSTDLEPRVGAVWLYQNLKELCSDQMFTRWGSQAIARYIPNSPLHKQTFFAARTLHAFLADQVRQREARSCVLLLLKSCQHVPMITPSSGKRWRWVTKPPVHAT